MRIVVVGTGYVGLVTGTCLAEVGHEVSCVDVDERKIEKLRRGISPIYEPGLDPLIARNIQHERLTFTTKLGEVLNSATVTFIAVGTPEREDGSADLQHVTNVARQIGQNLTNEMLVIVKSTVPVGTCDMVEKTIAEELKRRGSPVKFHVASNPEFLKEGVAVADCMRPDRIVIGVTERPVAATFQEMYEQFIKDDPSKLIVMDRRSSELTKYGSNSMLATRISFMNELSRLCEVAGADIEMVRRGMGSDARIGRKFLYAGPGYGGSCFPKDVAALIKTGRDHGVKLTVLESVSEANEAQKEFAANKILKFFNNKLDGKTIAIWGLAFKPQTDDVREAPALTLVRKFVDAGATVVMHDPQAIETFSHAFGEHPKIKYVTQAYDAARDADALVLLTEWSEYKQPNWDKLGKMMRQRLVFDLRNQYSREVATRHGFHFDCIGRPETSSLPITR